MRGSADEVLRRLVQFRRLERVALCHNATLGTGLNMSAHRLAQVITGMPCLALVVAGYQNGAEEWERAQVMAGRRVQLFYTRSTALAVLGDAWRI